MWNKTTIFGIGSFFLGNGVAGVLAWLGNTTPALVISIVFSIIGIGFFIYGFKLKDKKDNEQALTQITRLYDIIPILREMDKRLWKLAKKQLNQRIDIVNFNETFRKINEMLGIATSPLDPSHSVTELINDTKNIVREQEAQIGDKLAMMDYDSKLREMKNTSRLLDADGFGLKVQKETDKSYLRYNEMVDRYYDTNKHLVDGELKDLITTHIVVSEYFANMYLVLGRGNIITAMANVPSISGYVSPPTQANLEGFKFEANQQSNEIRIVIAEHIRELEKNNGDNESN